MPLGRTALQFTDVALRLGGGLSGDDSSSGDKEDGELREHGDLDMRVEELLDFV